MSLSKKHFVRMARCFAEALAEARTDETKTTIALIAREFADMSREQNSNFNRYTFYHACGLDNAGKAEVKGADNGTA